MQTVLDTLIQGHQTFQESLEEASSASFRLSLDTRNDCAAEHCRIAREFVFDHAIPHMNEEDEVLYPEAQRLGVPSEVIKLLSGDHDLLRHLAAELEREGLTVGATTMSDRLASLLERFVHVFDWHVAREEMLVRESADVLEKAS
ncbi:MAG: hemerythrin domain-containing protein [Polyangiaceae bacterium]